MYAFNAVKDGQSKITMKLKGITLNNTTMKQLNLKMLRGRVKQFIKDGTREEIEVVQNRIQRQKDRTIVTAPLRKKFRVVYDKRRVIAGGDTLPFGY